MSTLLFASCSGIRHAHSPFGYVAHNDLEQADWALKWERFFNFGHCEIKAEDLDREKLRVCRIEPAEVLSLFPEENTLYVTTHCHPFADQEPDKYLRIIPALKRKYALTEKRSNFLPGRIHVACSVRRGDVTPNLPERYTENAVILRALNSLREALHPHPVEFHLFSEGTPEEFSEFDGEATFHLSENTFQTMHDLISADVLVMGKSSFSYASALLSSGIIVYEPFWHRPLTDWIPLDKNGKVDVASVRKKLLHSAFFLLHS